VISRLIICDESCVYIFFLFTINKTLNVILMAVIKLMRYRYENREKSSVYSELHLKKKIVFQIKCLVKLFIIILFFVLFQSSNNASNLGVSEKREHLYKILVIGELGAGKTSIIKRYVHQFFSQHYRATIGVDFALKVLNWDPHTIIRLQLWDIAGQ